MIAWLREVIARTKSVLESTKARIEEGIPSSDKVSFQHRLGSQSSQTITHNQSLRGDAIVVSMQQEMYKDALHFYREARANHANHGTDPFVTWRDLRGAILFGFAAIESCINQFIDEHIETNKSRMTAKEIDRWAEKDGPVWISVKLTKGVELFGGARLDKDPLLWAGFRKFKELRNDLIHYRVSNRLFYNTDDLLNRVENAVCTISAVIKKIYLSHPANSGYPATFDEMP